MKLLQVLGPGCPKCEKLKAHAEAAVNELGIEATVEKILRRDLFGLEKYMSGFGVALHSCTVHRADQRDELVEVICNYLAEIGCNRRVATQLATLADELVTNAIYNAPRDGSGRPLYAGTSRREKVQLKPGEAEYHYDRGLVHRFLLKAGWMANQRLSITWKHGAMSP